MARKMVTRRQVDVITPIVDADSIELATVGGWQAVVKKGEFVQGDACIFFEVDSLVPLADPRFAFLKKPDKIVDHYRVRTIKLRGTLSQGLILPTNLFPELEEDNPNDYDNIIGVTKFEPNLPQGNQSGSFLTQFAPKTDAERVQNLVKEWDALSKHNWVATEKIDGTSCTVVWDVKESKVRVCSRNYEIEFGENLYWKNVKEHNLDNLVKKLAIEHSAKNSTAIQCEIYGVGIQKNPLKMLNQKIAIFSTFIDRKKILPHLDPHKMMAPSLNIPFPKTPADAITIADGLYSVITPTCLAEGIVWHSPSANVEPVKSINNKFLLKQER